MSSIQVLIPTYNKTKEDIETLYEFLNIKSDCIFANQCGENKIYSLKHNNHEITVVCSDTKGVSKNRNILKNNLNADIGICIDDDCPLVDNYDEIVLSAFADKNCDYAVFNGIWETHNKKLVHNKKTKRIKRFIDISYAGGPGLCFKKEAAKLFNLNYNEKVGVPNYICAGEDSLFYYDLSKSKAVSYRFSDVLFKVAIDETNSSYFKGINEQYIVTRGCILKKTHRILFPLFVLKHALRFKKQNNKLGLFRIIKYLNKGGRMVKTIN